MSVNNVGTTSPQSSTGTGSPKTQAGAWGTGQNRTAGNLLVALVTASGSTSAGTITESTSFGWTQVAQYGGTTVKAALFTLTATGGDTAPTFKSTIAGTSARCHMSVTLYELTDTVNPGTTPVTDTFNTAGTGTSGTLTVTTSAAVAGSGEFGLAVEVCQGSTAATNTWGTSGSWTNDGNDAGSSTYFHWVEARQAGPTSGSTLSYAPTHSFTSNAEAGVVAVLKPGTPPPFTVVQSAPTVQLESFTGPVTATFPSNTTAGNTLVACITTDANTANPAVSSLGLSAAMSVTATAGGSTSDGIALDVAVLSQAALTQNGATAAASVATSASITTTETGSLVYGATIYFPTGSAVANGSTTLIDDIGIGGAEGATFRSASATGTPGAETIGLTNTLTAGGVALLEVLPNGNITEDSSAPPLASTGTATTVTTGNFTPPAGTVLVALVASNGSTGQVTMAVTGGGLTWTEAVSTNVAGDGYAGVWVAEVPAGADNWQNAYSDPGTTQYGAAIWYDPDCAGGYSAVALRCSGGSGGTSPDLYLSVYEVQGRLAFDLGSNGDSASAVTSWSSGFTGTVTQSDEIAFAVAMASTAVPTVTGVGTWTTQSSAAGFLDQISGYQQTTSGASFTFSGTIPSGLYSAAVATFYASTSVQHNQSLAGSITVVGAQVVQIGAHRTVAATASGNLIRALAKSVTGSVTAAPGVIRGLSSHLAGSITAAAGSLAITKIQKLALTGAATAAGKLQNRIGPTLRGSATASGTQRVRIGKQVQGSVTAAGSLKRFISVAQKGSVAAAGTVSTKIVKLVTLAGSVTASAAQNVRISVTRAGQVTAAPALTRKVSTKLAGAATAAGALGRRIGKTVSGAVTAVGALGQQRVALLTLTTAATAAASLGRRISFHVRGAATAAPAIAKGLAQKLAAAVTTVATVAWQNAVRLVLHLSGSEADTNAFGGTASAGPYGGSGTQLDYGGSATDPNATYGGATADMDTYGGMVLDADTYGGLVLDSNAFGGSEDACTMQTVNITLAEYNDEVVDLTILNNGSAFNLTGYNLQVLLKDSAGDADTAPTTKTYSSQGGSPAITVTNAASGLATLKIPRADLSSSPAFTFWRCDVVDSSGDINTAIYGSVTITKL